MDEEMVDFRRPFQEFAEELVEKLPSAGLVRSAGGDAGDIEALLWVLIRLVYELGRALV